MKHIIIIFFILLYEEQTYSSLFRDLIGHMLYKPDSSITEQETPKARATGDGNVVTLMLALREWAAAGSSWGEKPGGMPGGPRRGSRQKQ